LQFLRIPNFWQLLSSPTLTCIYCSSYTLPSNCQNKSPPPKEKPKKQITKKKQQQKKKKITKNQIAENCRTNSHYILAANPWPQALPPYARCWYNDKRDLHKLCGICELCQSFFFLFFSWLQTLWPSLYILYSLFNNCLVTSLLMWIPFLVFVILECMWSKGVFLSPFAIDYLLFY